MLSSCPFCFLSSLLVCFVSSAFLSFHLVLLCLSVGSFLAPLFLFCVPSFLFCLFFVCHVTMTDVSFGSKLSVITYGFCLQRAYGFMSKPPFYQTQHKAWPLLFSVMFEHYLSWVELTRIRLSCPFLFGSFTSAKALRASFTHYKTTGMMYLFLPVRGNKLPKIANKVLVQALKLPFVPSIS